MNRPHFVLTDLDRWRLGTFLQCRDTAAVGSRRARFDLEAKIDEAEMIAGECAPESLVTMNSRLRLVDLTTGVARDCTLVYPGDEDLACTGVSVLSDLGRRLLGRSAGDIVRVNERGRSRQYKIDAVVYQPEAAGALAQ